MLRELPLGCKAMVQWCLMQTFWLKHGLTARQAKVLITLKPAIKASDKILVIMLAV